MIRLIIEKPTDHHAQLRIETPDGRAVPIRTLLQMLEAAETSLLNLALPSVPVPKETSVEEP